MTDLPLSSSGDLSSSALTPYLSFKYPYNLTSSLVKTGVTGSGAVSVENSRAKVSSGTTTGSNAYIRTGKLISDNAGGVVCRFTGYWSSAPTTSDSVMYVGLFDDSDGFAFGYKGTTFGIIHRNSASGSLVENFISMTSWSNYKRFAEHLPNFNPLSGGVPFQIRYQYLGYGNITFYIDDGGRYFPVHTIVYENQNQYPSLSNDELSMRVEVDNGSSEDDLVMYTSAMNVFFEGGRNVAPARYETEVALGNVKNVSSWNKFAYNSNVSTGTAEILAAFGGTGWTPITTASTLSIVSSSAQDDVGGTGASGLVLTGVDENYEEQIEVVTLDGLTPVVTTTQWYGLNRVAVYLAGSSKGNVGNITITSGGGQVEGYLPATQSTTQQLIFHVPRNSKALGTNLFINCNKITGSSPTITIYGYVYSVVSNSRYEVFRYTMDTQVENRVQYSPTEPFIIGPKSCVFFEVETDTNTTVVSGRIDLELHRDFNY